jgi:hypothetical protein
MPARQGSETLILDARHGNCYYEKGDGAQGFATQDSLGEIVEISGVYGASDYKRAVLKMIENGMATEQLEPLYLKASEAECNELK